VFIVFAMPGPDLIPPWQRSTWREWYWRKKKGMVRTQTSWMWMKRRRKWN